MTDQTGAAPAAAEPVAAPAAATIEAPITPPNPVESSGPEKAPAVESKPSATVKDAIAKAEAKLKEAPKDAPKPVEAKIKTETKTEQKPEPKPRDETGKFASTKPVQAPQTTAPEQKPAAEQPAKPTQFSEAPKRFSDEAKTHWATAPEPVRAEIHRAVKELETGINQYREVVEPLKPYLQLAQKHGTTISKALDQYIAIERALVSPDAAQKNAALNDVFQTAGINPREWAAHLLGQTPDQVASQQDSVIRELRQELAGLKQQIGGVTQNMQQQREQATLQEINKFAADHPRFEELADAITEELRHGYSLSEAYDRAERLNPAPAASAQAPVIPAPPAAEVQPKGSKSISGPPSPGSSPAARKQPSSSIRKALESAMARAS